MSILDDFESSMELVMEHDKFGIPLVSINDFDLAIAEIKELKDALKIAEMNTMATKHSVVGYLEGSEDFEGNPPSTLNYLQCIQKLVLNSSVDIG